MFLSGSRKIKQVELSCTGLLLLSSTTLCWAKCSLMATSMDQGEQTWHKFVVVGDADVVPLLDRLDVLGVGRVSPDAMLVHLYKKLSYVIKASCSPLLNVPRIL